MSLYEQWKNIAFESESEEEAVKFWNEYCEVEKNIYKRILGEKITTIKGNFADLAKEYEVDNLTFMGFIDGINTSSDLEIDLDEISEESHIEFNINLEKLYYNMLDANADWLFNLPEWDDLLTIEKRREIKKAYSSSKTIVKGEKIGRNEPCPCGSGKKYKKCCINK